MMRPQLRCFIPGRYWRLMRTPLSTLTSKNRRQSSSGICSNGFGSKMPRLLTRISTSGYFFATKRRSFRRAEVGRDSFDLAFQLRQCLVDAFLRPSVDDHQRAFIRQHLGDRKSDPRSRTGDQRALSFELQVHKC